MCLIVDANIAALVFRPTAPAPTDFEPLRKALFERRARAVWGGKLCDEYRAMRKYAGLIREMDRQGILRRVPDESVNSEVQSVEATQLCCSNDVHIIALARASRVKLLCSKDSALHTDFTNPKLVHGGKVYQNRSHRHLIHHNCQHIAKHKGGQR
jgi:hypothetical protein